MDRRLFIKNTAAAAAVVGLPVLPGLTKSDNRIFWATEKISFPKEVEIPTITYQYELEIEKSEFIDVRYERYNPIWGHPEDKLYIEAYESIPTGLNYYDSVIDGGLRKGTVNVIGARPKQKIFVPLIKYDSEKQVEKAKKEVINALKNHYPNSNFFSLLIVKFKNYYGILGDTDKINTITGNFIRFNDGKMYGQFPTDIASISMGSI